MRAGEFVAEVAKGVMDILRDELPGWPDYVIKDMVYSKIRNPDDLEMKLDHVRELSQQVGSWRLVQQMPLTFDQLDPDTRYRMKVKRDFGNKNPFLIPNDRERLERAIELVRTQGIENLPPVIFLQTDKGLELWEGWHRTMAAFREHPKGFRINAWIAQPAAVEEDLAGTVRKGLAGAALAGTMAMGSPAVAAEPPPMTTVAVVTIDGETRQYNLGTRFKDSREALRFVDDVLKRQGLSGYDINIRRGVAKTNENWAEGTDPIRAYHGNQGGIDTEQLHAPMWFTASRRDAEQYAGDDGYVVVADLDITNPYVIQPGQEEPNTVLRRWQELQAQGYDGIYDRRLGDWIPFTREQIRVISKDDTFMGENFADGKKPGRKGLSKRVGVSQKMSIAQLKKIASTATGERRRMAQWNLNMKRGRKK
jgi:hypothetical protein